MVARRWSGRSSVSSCAGCCGCVVVVILLFVYIRKMREKDPDNEIREAFRVFDAEGAGYIGQRWETRSDLTNFLI